MESLNFTEFKSIIDLLKKFPTEQHCIDHLEAIRWNGVVVSPFDPNSKVYRCVNNRYKCRNTNTYFNVRTCTIFEDTKLPLQKWFMAIYLIVSHKKGISSHQLARDLDVTQKTGWFVLHRIRYAFGHENFKKELSNTVEADETFVGGKESNKHISKRQSKNQGGKGKVAVLGLLERKGDVKAVSVGTGKVKAESIVPVILDTVKPGSKLMTDEMNIYPSLSKIYDHNAVKHNAEQYVNGDCHTNSIEGFWSLFKRGIIGIYHQIGKDHVQQYLNEFAYRYNTRSMTEAKRFNHYLSATNDRRLTYKQLISHE